MTAIPSAAVKLRRQVVALWRDSGVLQLGLDGGAVILDAVPLQAMTALSLLEQPRTRSELIHLLPELSTEWVDWLLLRLEEAALLETPPPAVASARIAVGGAGALAGRLIRALAEHQVPASRWNPGSGTPAGAPTLVVLAEARAEPDRAETDRLVAAGQAHLVVRLEPGRAVVGPLVMPGLTPCVRCLDLNCCGLDPAWPRLVAQLCLQQVRPDPLLLDWAVTQATVTVRGFLTGRPPQGAGRTLELELDDLTLRARRWSAHPRCGCLIPVDRAELGTLAG